MADKKAALIYKGPHDGVDLPDLRLTALRGGGPVEVPEDVAKALLEQAPDDWEKAKGGSS